MLQSLDGVVTDASLLPLAEAIIRTLRGEDQGLVVRPLMQYLSNVVGRLSTQEDYSTIFNRLKEQGLISVFGPVDGAVIALTPKGKEFCEINYRGAA